MVQSAIGRPYSGYYRPMAAKAAALVQSMATNHGFADGNKRTTVILMWLLLEKSGYRLVPLEREDIQQAVETVVLNVVNRALDFDGLVAWFTSRIERA